MAFTAVVAIGVGVMAYGASQAEDAEDAAHAGRQEQAAQQRTQFAAQQRMADIKNSRERADMARKTRLARAQVLNTGANTNTMGSSGVAGGIASAGSQGASNLGMFNAIAANQADIITSQGKEAEAVRAIGDAAGAMSNAQAMISIGGAIFSAGGGFKTIFDGPPKKS